MFSPNTIPYQGKRNLHYHFGRNMLKTVWHSYLFMVGPADPARTDSVSTGQLL